MPLLVNCLPCKHEEPSRNLTKLNLLASQACPSLSSGIGECSPQKIQWRTTVEDINIGVWAPHSQTSLRVLA